MLTPGRSNKIIKKTVSKPISEEPKNEGRVNTITKGTISVPNNEYKKLPIPKITDKVTSTMSVNKSKGLMPGKPTPVPVSKAKEMAAKIASKLKRG